MSIDTITPAQHGERDEHDTVWDEEGLALRDRVLAGDWRGAVEAMPKEPRPWGPQVVGLAIATERRQRETQRAMQKIDMPDDLGSVTLGHVSRVYWTDNRLRVQAGLHPIHETTGNTETGKSRMPNAESAPPPGIQGNNFLRRIAALFT